MAANLFFGIAKAACNGRKGKSPNLKGIKPLKNIDIETMRDKVRKDAIRRLGGNLVAEEGLEPPTRGL